MATLAMIERLLLWLSGVAFGAAVVLAVLWWVSRMEWER